MVFEGGVSGKSLGHEGKTLVNETSALIKDTPKNSLVKFHHVKLQWKEGHL